MWSACAVPLGQFVRIMLRAQAPISAAGLLAPQLLSQKLALSRMAVLPTVLLRGLELFDGFGEDVAYDGEALGAYLIESVLRRMPVRNFQVDHVDRSNAAG
jgi:hypothetical protein